MREILTALSFNAVLLAPAFLAMRATENEPRPKRPRRSKGPITLFGNTNK